jgi:predicted ester cyclase
MDSSQRGSQAPRIVVERYLDEVLNGRSVTAIDELISDRTLKQRVVAFRSAFPDIAVEARQVLAEEALVAVHLIGSARHEGLFQGCPPTGRRWTTTCTAIYRVERGQIADSWINWDLLALMEQLECIQRAERVSA